ncbi:MAG: V-type ATP synthase subunit E family protein [Candidatus Omnitrophica bacterium]|nr:V-type ATP synthase subunit E family protein [Candidatus Omnitrophota bacterium]
MDNKILGKINQENAEVICAKISQDADEEIRIILEKGRRESENIISLARKVVEDKNQVISKDLEREIQKSREKILSSLNLEKKRLVLGEKDKFIQSVLANVIKNTQDFRRENSYPEFLENAIIEGVEVIEEGNIAVYYSYLDERIFNSDFTRKIEKACSQVLKTGCSLKFNKADFSDLGVIVNSVDGRIMYDNRFLARLERVKEKIYMELLKDSF